MTIEYLSKLPAVVPGDKVLVHNMPAGHVTAKWPTRRLGSRGFRAWLSPPDLATLEVCPCGWAPELGQHFRVAAAARRAGV